jgi:hypothetical protein
MCARELCSTDLVADIMPLSTAQARRPLEGFAPAELLGRHRKMAFEEVDRQPAEEHD